MKYFDRYTSNTLAAAANQHFFITEDSEREYTSRVFYKIFAGGRYNYSFLFSNIIDSTYADGSVSHMNLVCDEWDIVSASIAIADTCEAKTMPKVSGFVPIAFGGSTFRTVNPGEFFSSDPIEIDANKGQYICLEMTFKGRMIPYHEESIIPIFSLKDGEWVYDKKMPIAFIYTMNASEELSHQIDYHKIHDHFEMGLSMVFTKPEHLYVYETYQFKDYNKYVSDAFDEKERMEIRKTQFPKDLESAFELGRSVAIQAKQHD